MEIFLNTQNADFFCISEHWLTAELPNVGNSYILVANFSRTNHKNGGVSIYCRNRFSGMFKVSSVDSIEKDFECVAAEFPNLQTESCYSHF